MIELLLRVLWRAGSLAHHSHLCGIHGIHRVAWLAQASHLLQLLLACARHHDKLVLDVVDVLVLGLRGHECLCLEVDRGPHHVHFRGVGFEQAILGEKLHAQSTTLLWGN